MTPPIAPRPTPVAVKVERVAATIVISIIGLIIFAGAGYGEYFEIRTPPTHTVHILVWAGIAIFGLLLAFPGATLTALKSLVGIASPYLGKWASRNNDAAGGGTP